MNTNEFNIFASALRTYYPRENLLPNKEAMELWYRQLKDIPYKLAETVLEKWVATQKWSPSIAEIRAVALEVQNGASADWAEAWDETKKAIRKWGYMAEAKAMDSLSPLTRQTVQRLGWKTLCASEDETADRANFRMTYETLQNREKQDSVLPAYLKETIKLIQGDKNELLLSS